MSSPSSLTRSAYSAFAAGRHEEAATLAARALGTDPDEPGALTLLGRLALLEQSVELSVALFRRVLERHPRVAAVWLDLARSLAELNRHADAIDATRRALQLAPTDTPALLLQGRLLLETGQRAAGIAAYRAALRATPDCGDAWVALAHARDIAADSADCARMRKLAEDTRGPAGKRAAMHYALAAVLRDTADDAGFMHHLLTGNALQRSVSPGTREDYRLMFDRLDAAFSPATLARSARAQPASPVPIFIVGMPRSGTSLTEQLLAAHPSVRAGGELNIVRGSLAQAFEREAGAPFPSGFERLSAAAMTRLASEYARRVAPIAGGAPFVTDKTPGNYHVAGLLPLLFPECRIVHVMRDALDNCFSILQYAFDDRSPHTCDMELLAYSRARYEQQMRRWETLCGERILTLHYETLVQDPRAEGQRLFAFCGLDWDDGCLEFHTRSTPTRTFSAMQVRDPVHATRVGSAARYRAALQPLEDALHRERAALTE